MTNAIAMIAAVFTAFCVFLFTLLAQSFFRPFALWSEFRAISSIAIGMLLGALAGRHSFLATLARVRKSPPQSESISKTEQPR